MKERTLSFRARGFEGFLALQNNIRLNEDGVQNYIFALFSKKGSLGGWRTGTLIYRCATVELLNAVEQRLTLKGASTGRWYIKPGE
jgi:hypothetical protein